MYHYDIDKLIKKQSQGKNLGKYIQIHTFN